MFALQEILALKNRFYRLSASFLPWIGGVLMALAALSAANTWWTFKSWPRAEAVVTETSASQDAMGNVTYATHLRFRLPSGQLVTFTDPVTSTDPDDPDLPTAATVPVAYPSGLPGSARIASIGRLYRLAIVLGILGIAFFDVGLISRLRLKKSQAGLSPKRVKPPMV
ncbi:DUF3592 domain-containing protein [Granulicella sp. 5B5]|uniref:DUF3592 domain-containing protein n=1 Tax=Granulicella sp. 5B5 TaxID=1617967 RepID=UPI0015F52E1E|nr:DUF3592 domain-containing protein [Granulicella sp. 5B5]QMV17572.1 DUF3592 domain-containing protein [Granulicella sp. 5B5]